MLEKTKISEMLDILPGALVAFRNSLGFMLVTKTRFSIGKDYHYAKQFVLYVSIETLGYNLLKNEYFYSIPLNGLSKKNYQKINHLWECATISWGDFPNNIKNNTEKKIIQKVSNTFLKLKL